MENNPKIVQYNSTKTIDEIQKIKRIELECRLSAWSESDYIEERLRKDSIFLAAEISEEPVGFLVARVFGNEANLLNFGVLKHFRTRGIGKMLFRRLVVETTKQEVESVWLEVRSSNQAAVEFYQKQDFHTMQIRKNFYANPIDDALLMRLLLSTAE